MDRSPAFWLLFSFFLSFIFLFIMYFIALFQGEAASIEQIWADGKKYALIFLEILILGFFLFVFGLLNFIALIIIVLFSLFGIEVPFSKIELQRIVQFVDGYFQLLAEFLDIEDYPPLTENYLEFGGE